MSTTIPSLPDDLLLSFLARVSSQYYPNLSLVSKRFRSLIASPELYQTRSFLGLTESFLYVCLRFPPDPNPRLFTLKKTSSANLLVPIPVPNSPPAHWSGHVAVGHNIYNIGGLIENVPSSRVSILDCRSNTWREALSMRVERFAPSASVVDGKIYVAGGNKDGEYPIEVFDAKSQIWDHVPNPCLKIQTCFSKSACIEGKFHLMCGSKSLAYDPKEGRWDLVEQELGQSWSWFSNCVIDNVLYCYDNGAFQWYDTKVRLWKKMEGLVGLPKFDQHTPVKMADYGGKMAVLWDEIVPSMGYKNKMIRCAVILLKRLSKSEKILGQVEWCDVILAVPRSNQFEYAIGVTF
ncbi:F-box domain [Arabidopsis suecica]|uniref:F-box domain n=1 Tax=Arabidopsis suecica TaxID=45249 RepID=A0A8T2BBM9_ARASU|nr:F-box domain [Arabidopsis suecica]